jgi:hypothetical protein
MRGVLPLALAGLVSLAACGGGGGGSRPVVVVTNLDDTGEGSLREVLAEAPSGAIVRFDESLLGTIFLATGELVVDHDLEIDGPGADVVEISGGLGTRIFRVDAGVEATIRGLRLVDGSADRGAGVRSEGSLVLDGLVVDSCHADRAGGVASFGDLLLVDCTVRFCTGGNGGGVAVEAGTGRIERSTFESNSTTGNSGGGLLVNEGALALVTNCTFSGNFTTGADRVGGAIAVFSVGDVGELRLAFCTLAGNSATGFGGGIFVSSSSVVRMRGCVVSGNTAPTGPDAFFSASADAASLGHNVVRIGDGSGLVHGVNGDQVGSAGTPLSTLLGTLGDNGGPTETIPLLVGSPARDVVPPASCLDATGDDLEEDQRSEPRPSGAACDAGAFEA